MTAYIGIDLGTTTTLLAVGSVRGTGSSYSASVVKIEQQNSAEEAVRMSTMPSVAYFPEPGRSVVGLQAKEDGPHDPHNRYVRAVKRLMGRDVLPFSFHGQSYSPAQISALYIQKALETSINTGQEIEAVTVTVPASFTTFQRHDTKQAVLRALRAVGKDLTAEEESHLLISEPLAALLHYIAKDIDDKLNRLDLQQRPRVLVYDIGGGTLDLTLVKLGLKDESASVTIQNVRFEVEHVGRYNEVGGEDCDELLARYLLVELCTQHPRLAERKLKDEERIRISHSLMEFAEKVKIDFNECIEEDEESLTQDYFVRVLDETHRVHLDLDQHAILGILEPLLGDNDDPRNFVRPIFQLLNERKVDVKELDYLLCVGGMIKFLPLQEIIRDRLKVPTLFASYPQEAVAEGAAIYSLLKSFDDPIKEPASDDYYIKMEGSFHKVLSRGADYSEVTTRLRMAAESQQLDLHFFSGDECEGEELPTEMIPSLMFQGGDTVDLGRTFAKNTPIDVCMRYDGPDKIPQTRVLIDGEEVYQGRFITSDC